MVSEETKVAQETEEEMLAPLDQEELEGLIWLHRQMEVALCKEAICKEVERRAEECEFTTKLTPSQKYGLVRASVQGLPALMIHINKQMTKDTTGAAWKKSGPWLRSYIDRVKNIMAAEVWQKINEKLALQRRLDGESYKELQQKQHNAIAMDMIKYFVGYAAAWPGKQAFVSRG